jgi:hypothetical protein
VNADVRAFTELLKCHPDLLHPAPAPFRGADMERRVADEVHPCLRCGRLAEVALVATSRRGGARWLDLCHDDYHWLLAGVDPRDIGGL